MQEIRSVSKFGLSVVTIVFDEDMGTYLPRQLIAEKIKTASELIPEGFGSPEMGPISTGLGEIYQYVLDVKPEHKDRYSVADLRTIQDWIVKRQLSGRKLSIYQHHNISRRSFRFLGTCPIFQISSP